MAEETLADEEEAVPKRRGIPGWLWFCGGGCLLLLVALVVAVFFGARYYREATNEDHQWTRLAQALPYDRRGEHLQMGFGVPVLYRVFTLHDDRGYELLIYDLDRKQAAQFRDQLFSPEFKGVEGLFGFGAMKDPELGRIDVQGRSLAVVRIRQSPQGESAYVDATLPDSAGGLFIAVVRSSEGEGRLTDEEIQKVLAPFRIGPDHASPPPESRGPAEAEPPPEASPPAAEDGGK